MEKSQHVGHTPISREELTIFVMMGARASTYRIAGGDEDISILTFTILSDVIELVYNHLVVFTL